MSKITGKKKSCFEITSVTQAQGATSNVPDDPDEPRTEDVSAETFDVSRVEQGVCDRGSPEETLLSVGDCQEGQIPNTGPVNGGLSYKSAPTGRVTPHNAGGSVPVSAAAQPFVPGSSSIPAASVSTGVAHTAPSSTCSSRFRVIKLDHGTGEPFRRGRWTCTEFYEKESDSNVSRTVDSIKPTLTPEHSIDRDSGLGVTSNSIVSSSTFSAQAFENSSDSGYSVSAGHLTHSQTSDPLQQGYSLSPQIGSGASAFQPTGFATTASLQTKQAQVNMQPVTPQTFLFNTINGVHQGAMQQKTPIIPPATLPQQFVYSLHPTGFSSNHPEYCQQPFGANAQNLPITSSHVVSSTSQASPPPFTPASPATQVLVGDTVSAQGPVQQVINAPVMSPGNTQQQPVNQTQPSGGLGVAPSPSTTTTSSLSGGQNVPATVPNTTSIPLGVSSQVPSTGGHVQLQGAHGGAAAGLHSGFSNQADDGRQKTDALPHHSAGAVPGKDGVKTPVSEGLSLPTPSVNSLFNIQLPMDEDEDSASGASVVAIDNKIEQAMDLVKSHLMYAVREEVEVLKEQIKELYERNSVLEHENAVLKSLANTEQLSQLSGQLSSLSAPLQLHQYPLVKNSTPSLVHHEGSQSVPYQPNITSA